MIKFKCLSGPLHDREFELSDECVVLGRGKECTVSLDDEACSRYHARIVETPSGFVITDLGSTNGVRVNNQAIVESRLRFGDRFLIGRNVFLFMSQEEGEAAADDHPHIENTVTIESVRKLCAQMGSADLEELRRANGIMQAAYRFSQAISATLDGDDLYSLISQAIFEDFKDAERVCLFLRRKESEDLKLVRNVSREKAEEFPVSRSLLKRVESEWLGILASDAASDSRFADSDSVVFSGLRSLMLVPMVARSTFVGAIYVENCTRPACFKKFDLELLTLLGTQAAFAIQNAFLFEDIQVSFYETIRGLSNALEAKDQYTHGHSGRVAKYAGGIGREMGFAADRLQRLRTAAELHDIGKIAIPEAIISKKGKLTPEEFEAIKKHPQRGVDILKPIRFLEPMLPFILHHHEKFAGGGYPGGIQGEEIPLEARIIHLADSFDAMTTQRPYNEPMSFQDAIQSCNKGAGTLFDPQCVAALVQYLSKETMVPAPRPKSGSRTEVGEAVKAAST